MKVTLELLLIENYSRLYFRLPAYCQTPCKLHVLILHVLSSLLSKVLLL